VLYLGFDPLAAPIRGRPDYTALLRRVQHPTAG
jgi:hypothetical protein